MAAKKLPSDGVADTVRDRKSKYGHPADIHHRAAQIWSGILGVEVQAYQVALCQAGLKLAREAEMPNVVPDNLHDVCGYIDCAALIYERRPPNEPNG